MADRYWVGGTASWDGTAGTKWSATSGGPGGASVPTTADDVFFNASSTGTVTIAAGNTGAKSINCTGFAGSLTGSAEISVAGSITLSTGMTYNYTGTITFSGTGTLITAGKNFNSPINVNGAGITLTLGDAFNGPSSTITVTNGTFNTGNYSVTTIALLSAFNTNSRTITLGSSTVNLTGSTPFTHQSETNLTINAGTSQINFTSNLSISINTVFAITLYNVSFTSTSGTTRTLNSSFTFNNLTSVVSSSGLTSLNLAANITVSGTVTCSGAGETRRGFVFSSVLGSGVVVNTSGLLAAHCDFRDILLSGVAVNTAPSGAGDCGGNSGIIFPIPKTVYRVGTDTTWVGNASWSLSSGGAGSDVNFPLPQDTGVINDATTLTGALGFSNYNIASIDFSNRTSGITLNHNTNVTSYGSYKLGAGVTVSGTNTYTFSSRGTANFTSVGKTITFPIIVNAPSGTFLLNDAINSSNSLRVDQGTFNANGYNVTSTIFDSNNQNLRTITMGAGLWTLTSTGTVWEMSSTQNVTLNKDSANILLSNNSTSLRRFTAGAGTALSFNKLTIGGTATGLVILNASGTSFTELASTKTVAHTISISGFNLGTINTWSVSGSLGNVVTFSGSTTQRIFTLQNTTVSGINYLNVINIRESNGNKFYVGPNSTNGGNNFNVYFTDPPVIPGNMFMLF